MSKEGFRIITVLVIFTGVVATGAMLTSLLLLTVFTILSAVFTVFVIYFFRDPERKIPHVSEAVLSPADGKVIEIKQEVENEYLSEPSTRVSIFFICV